jgi:hypothetical protein
VLTATQAHRARRRPTPSLKQQYQEYVLQRIEGFKNSIPRDELLRLGDEAVAEMQSTAEAQFVLTEVLMLESVDRLIMRRLALRSYRRWRQQFLKLREAQRQPTHWGLEPDCPLVPLLPRLEDEDPTLVVGAEPVAYLLAAHDAAVTFIASDLRAVERVEAGMANESLASLFTSFFVQPGAWLPPLDGPLALIVIDAGSLTDATTAARTDFITALQEQTVAGGIHVLLPGRGRLAPEALLSCYDGWIRDEVARSRRRGSARRAGLVLTRPAETHDELSHAAGDH